jgi:hypothetical protein
VRLRDNFVQHYRALTYSGLSNSFDYKLYLDNVKVETHRTALATLRVSSHILHIETGRWHKPNAIPVGEIKCNMCDNDTIEDEFHVVLECRSYQQLRKVYIARHYYVFPSMQRFSELMSSANSNTIIYLAACVHKDMQIRYNCMSHGTISTTLWELTQTK